MNILEILLGQLPEAIYFSIFIMLTKQLKQKRALFIFLMTADYLMLLNISNFSTYARISYFIMTFIILKMLYKERAQITDIFTMGIASLILIIISSVCFLLISITLKDIIICNILAKIILFTILFIFKNKLHKIQSLYKRLWNRNNKPKKIKSATFRCINVVLFNFMFYSLNAVMVYCLFLNGGE